MKAWGRSRFLGGTASAIAAFAIVRSPAKPAQFEYKMAHTLPASHPQHARSLQLWDAVARESNGRLHVRVFPNSELGGQEAMLAQLRLGAVQILSVGDNVYSNVVPSAGITNMGFAFKDEKVAWTAVTGALGDYVRKELAAKGLYQPRGAHFDLGMRQVTSSVKPIRTVADFAGFKIRVPPAPTSVDLFRTLGAAPVSLSQGEVYTSLQTHVCDGQEGPYLTFDSFKLYEVQKYASVTNHVWTGNSMVLNAPAWQALPTDLQDIVDRNITKYCLLERDDSWRLNDGLAAKLERGGMAFNNADTAGMRAHLSSYYTKWRGEFGNTLWSLLEAGSGVKLG